MGRNNPQIWCWERLPHLLRKPAPPSSLLLFLLLTAIPFCSHYHTKRPPCLVLITLHHCSTPHWSPPSPTTTTCNSQMTHITTITLTHPPPTPTGPQSLPLPNSHHHYSPLPFIGWPSSLSPTLTYHHQQQCDPWFVVVCFGVMFCTTVTPDSSELLCRAWYCSREFFMKHVVDKNFQLHKWRPHPQDLYTYTHNPAHPPPTQCPCVDVCAWVWCVCVCVCVAGSQSTCILRKEKCVAGTHSGLEI